MKYKLKTEQPYFNDIKSGKKNFELRLNDHNFQVGDILILDEYDKERGYSGQQIQKEVTYVLKDCFEFGLRDNFCILGLKDIYIPDSDWDFEKD